MRQNSVGGLASKLLLAGVALGFVPYGCETATRRGDVYVSPSFGSVAYADPPAQESPSEEEKKDELTLEEITKIVENAKSVEEILAPEVIRLKTDYEKLQSNLYKMFSTVERNFAVVMVYHSSDSLQALPEDKSNIDIRSGVVANLLVSRTALSTLVITTEDARNCVDIFRDYKSLGYPDKGISVPSFLLYTKGNPYRNNQDGWVLRDVMKGGPLDDKSIIPTTNNLITWSDWNSPDGSKVEEAKRLGKTYLFQNTGKASSVDIAELAKR